MFWRELLNLCMHGKREQGIQAPFFEWLQSILVLHRQTMAERCQQCSFARKSDNDCEWERNASSQCCNSHSNNFSAAMPRSTSMRLGSHRPEIVTKRQPSRTKMKMMTHGLSCVSRWLSSNNPNPKRKEWKGQLALWTAS